MSRETKAKFTGYVDKVVKFQGLFNTGCIYEIHLTHIISNDWKAKRSKFSLRLSDSRYEGNLLYDSKIEFDGLYSISKDGSVSIRYPKSVRKLY